MVAVVCQHCGARYETELPVEAVERIRRCSQCGRPALALVFVAPEPPDAAA
jgi:hypothetical protein